MMLIVNVWLANMITGHRNHNSTLQSKGKKIHQQPLTQQHQEWAEAFCPWSGQHRPSMAPAGRNVHQGAPYQCDADVMLLGIISSKKT